MDAQTSNGHQQSQTTTTATRIKGVAKQNQVVSSCLLNDKKLDMAWFTHGFFCLLAARGKRPSASQGKTQ